MAASYIDFGSMSGFFLETILSHIYRTLKIASIHRGRVFGGFVRDVIVPRIADPICGVRFKDIDIWFTTQDDADNFVKQMGQAFIEISAISDNAQYKLFNRKHYHMFDHDTCLGWFDIIVSDTVPVNDFNINKLTCLFHKGGKQFESHGDESVATLINAINNKQTTMLSPYINYMNTPHHLDRTNRIYLSKGWTILYSAQIPTNLTLSWIRQNMKQIPPQEHPNIHLKLGINNTTHDVSISDHSSDKISLPLIDKTPSTESSILESIKDPNNTNQLLGTLIPNTKSHTKEEISVMLEMMKLVVSKLK